MRHPTDTITECYKVEPEQIGYISFIIHSYEGIAVVRTIDQKAGIIEILISPDFLEDLHTLLKELREEIDIIPWSG